MVSPLLKADLINGLSHITGGGIVGNTSRILRDGLELHVSWGSWDMPPIFDLIQRAGEITSEEMRHVFNLGVGMILVVAPNNVDNVMNQLAAERPFLVGSIATST